ncbi:tRNA uridine-5-carboxymethylaminomethyl(34) synthesis GTPase MnmE [Erythrobacter sp. LQ02-29]|uniref:tRNA uridine-5-carboxymethylaminomethyl(34) synthesis GTPase MnmE n=1 Tax=Erythrobacter sp. LQ02-29 TaxID=2920384 RepID=UPI001F4E3514|nr:tRNA uridine-5-carboxymethylaminomethyl(34) synthesis GTPase MnmE [Erythrobacter sp. LQ02-29]MCP9221835.1 tRNA uridine-5-carboxymethylaminomethyl(34) synthesis GTPase MnmE [Erythrobacter sp. LQ02-29]
MTTIFALSSGAPPAAIGIVRISGPEAGQALIRLCGALPPERTASLRTVRDAAEEVLDRALVLWFPGPASATGEDCAEIHCHGGRAVIAAVETALAAMPGLARAEPGAFTRRAFTNGRIDLAEAEGLADLLTAETELQRRVAQAQASGEASRQVAEWRDEVLRLSAWIEALLDFSDEDDVDTLSEDFRRDVDRLVTALEGWLARPPAERLRDGVRVVLSGPPNAGKSSLFNMLLSSEAAIISPVAGTTRDVIERPVAIDGVPFVLIDTAGLRSETGDEIEAVGIARAAEQMASADIVLWLGTEGKGPDGALEIETRVDLEDQQKENPAARVSGKTGEGLSALAAILVERARTLLPRPGESAVNARQRRCLERAHGALHEIGNASDPLLIGESLRAARAAFDDLLGYASTEHMLDALFGRFCIGK